MNEPAKRGPKPKPKLNEGGFVMGSDGREEINSLARRIWEGQSPDLPRNERVARIMQAIKDKGYNVEDLTFIKR